VTPTAAALDLPRAARLFHAFSDETRLAVLALLGDGERCVCDLQVDLGAAQSRLSFHLKVLKEAGLVTDRKEGRWSYYTLVPEAFGEAHDVVRALAARAAGRAQAQGRRALLRLTGPAWARPPHAAPSSCSTHQLSLVNRSAP
jgi:ArsR family transcriptional regulator